VVLPGVTVWLPVSVSIARFPVHASRVPVTRLLFVHVALPAPTTDC
jgi:hypothetical protein